jgi:predicted enzyme related to lactoylglutathione lyase
MPRVIHFEISADDPERAVRFYEKAFGWRTRKWPGPMDYWLITTGEPGEPGIDGAIMHRQDPGAPVVNTIGVPSIEQSIERVKAAGGEVLTPKMPIPGVGWFANCKDSEGNMFGIMQPDESVTG